VCLFITTVPIIKLLAWGEGDSGGVTKRNLDGLSARLVDVWNAQLHGIFLKLALSRVTQPFCTNVPGISPDLTLSPDLQI
jgi:hypothetical protein